MKKQKTLLWLDDLRDPFSKLSWVEMYAPEYSGRDDVKIVWVKNYDEFVDYIKTNGLPNTIAFDHDLGEEKTGYDVAKWLVEYCIDNRLKIPEWKIQSANLTGRINIDKLLKNYIEFKDRYNRNNF